MNDFMKWCFYDAPEWVRFVIIPIVSAFVLLVLILIIVIFIWAGRNGYWIVFPAIPAVAILAILRAYQKSREKQK